MKTYETSATVEDQGQVRDAIVFVEEPAAPALAPRTPVTEDIFADMRPYMVDADGVDDSREAIYTRMEGPCENVQNCRDNPGKKETPWR